MATTATSFNKGRDRFYVVDGVDKDLPSVTTILSAVAKPALVNWSAKVERALVAEIAKEVHLATPINFSDSFDARLKQSKYACNTKLDAAGEIGTALHAAIETELYNRMGGARAQEPLQKEAQWAFDAWLKWADENKLEPLLIEQQVYSKKWGYAGTTDIVGKIKGGLVVGDWKTSSGVYLEHLIQVSAYREALFEMGHFTGAEMGGVIVKLPKTAKDKGFKPLLISAADMDGYFKTFLAIRDLWVAIKAFEATSRYK